MQEALVRVAAIVYLLEAYLTTKGIQRVLQPFRPYLRQLRYALLRTPYATDSLILIRRIQVTINRSDRAGSRGSGQSRVVEKGCTVAESRGLAIISLCVSVVTAGFTFYQWWHSENEAKISAAIDISKDWIADTELTKYEKSLRELVYHAKKATDEEQRMADIYFSRLEYIALLLNQGKIDERYLAATIKCSLSIGPSLIPLLKDQNELVFQLIPTHQLQTASPKFDCRDKDPKAPR